MKKHQWLGILCSGLCVATANAQTIIDDFEYATDDDMLAAWLPDGAVTATLSDSVAPRSTGKKSLKLEINFPSVAWTTETVRGVDLPNMVSISQSQFITYRLRGDTNFANADFRGLYLYAYDDSGNFGRWGPAEPSNPDWGVINFAASTIGQPWDSTALPDLSRIVKFAWFIYGSQAAIDAYTATIYIDDLMVRDTVLTEFPAPAAPRELIDDFEGYTNDDALRSSYSYQNSSATTVASLETPAPQGTKALKLAIDFGTGQWPWGSVRSAKVAPFSLPTNAVVSFRFKGDPALATVADDGTVFELSFYDKAGNGVNYWAGMPTPISSDWITLQAQFQDFGDTTTVDIGNLVQWRLLVEGWTGTADSTAMSGTFYVDDIRITVPSAPKPSLAVTRDSAGVQFAMSNLTTGASYELRTSPDFSQWTMATTITAAGTTATWSVKPDQPKAFYQLLQK
jgi:Carbohydrate binding domain (family 11)